MRSLTLVALVLSLALISCAKTDVKPTEPVAGQNWVEPTPEEEARIKLSINFDGYWSKTSNTSKTIIIIQGKKGRIVAPNGSEIPITVKYLSPDRIKISEEEYNPRYLENWLPQDISRYIYKNPSLKAYSILDIKNDNMLTGYFYGWEVIHCASEVKEIRPFNGRENWYRIK